MCMKSVPVVLDDLREWVDAMLSTTFSRVGLGQIGIVLLPCIDTLSGALEPLLSTMSEIVIAHYEVLRWYKKNLTIITLKRLNLKVSLASDVRFVVLFVLVDLFNFPWDNDQHPRHIWSHIWEKPSGGTLFTGWFLWEMY